jgi:16S rRNA (cytosine1402-N4)-methyltransferase
MKERRSEIHNEQSAQNQSGYHVPVLFHEALEALHIDPAGVYVDCTFGGGGHSLGILQKLNERGKIIAFDQDADAAINLPGDDRVIFVPHNFRYLQRFLRLHKIEKVDGVLADLGVSSHQFDEAARGFSTRFEGPLDMRMDRRQELTAAMILSTFTEAQLHKMFEQYGEVTNSKTLAKHIVQNRRNAPLKTISEFKNLLKAVVKGNPNKYLAQVFQAVRMQVNDEMGVLKDMLQQLPQVLKPGGRAAIITFHSLEDRLVKNFFKQGAFEEVQTNAFGQSEIKKEFKVITKKPIVASDEELKKNPRARSAKLRVAEKL